MSMKNNISDKTYWDEVWSDRSIPPLIKPENKALRNYVNRRFHEFFSAILSGIATRNKVLLEVGCARSIWLPYFSQHFGLNVSGLDYSEIGCEQSRKILSQTGVQGEIVCCDFFSPPSGLLGKFDIVISFGVVEHFVDTQSCIKALARFLKPGGLLVTNIPNMVGLIGAIEKAINREIYDIHVPLDRELLANAHRSAGLKVLQCDYFLSTNFGVLNLNGLDQKSISWRMKNIFRKMMLYLSGLVWIYERAFGPIKPNRLLSPYVNCVAQKEE